MTYLPTAKMVLNIFSAAILGLTVGASARPLDSHFGDFDSCYQRIYSKDHLNKNKRQRVAEIRFDHFPGRFGTYDENNVISFNHATGEVHFSISVTFRNANRRYTNGGICTPDGGRYRCQIECDGGSFVLKDSAENSILLINKSGFVISGCGGEEYRVLKPEPDDKIFRLDRMPDQYCIAPEQPKN